MKTINRLAITFAIALASAACLRAQEDDGSPLEEAIQSMKVAGDHLGKKATDKPTQTAQEEAVSKLDALIEELEKQKSALGNGANPNPTRPAMESQVRNGPGGSGDLHGARMQGDRWGELPAHERDRILQSLTEGFPPHYQAVLEAYYKRLAVEKRAEDPDAAAAPKLTPPAKVETKATTTKPAAMTPTKSTTTGKKPGK